MGMKAAFITIHGMGETPPTYSDEIIRELTRRLGPKFANLQPGRVYYQGILQPNEQRVWNSVARRVKWDELRKFLLFGFGDAAGLESGKEEADSVYTLAQIEIARELYRAAIALDVGAPIVMLAQSRGCQVFSCYMWDAQLAASGKPVDVGIWKDIKLHEAKITGGPPLTAQQIAILQGASLNTFFTTGCNIPIFVAAHATQQIEPFPKPNASFEWHNYYDRDDVLGWPLADLSPAYAQLVSDHPINAGGGIMGWLLKSWNPMSHGQYWGDDDLLDPLTDKLSRLL